MVAPSRSLYPRRLGGNGFGLHDTEVIIDKGKTPGALAVGLNEKGAHGLG